MPVFRSTVTFTEEITVEEGGVLSEITQSFLDDCHQIAEDNLWHIEETKTIEVPVDQALAKQSWSV